MCSEGKSDRCRELGIVVSAAMSGPLRRHRCRQLWRDHKYVDPGNFSYLQTLKILRYIILDLVGVGVFFSISFQTLFEVLIFKNVCQDVIFCETLDVKESTAVSKLKAVPVTTIHELRRNGCKILRKFSSA